MKVLVEVDGSTLNIACGHGNQSLKWLAVAAAERLAQGKPRGRGRLRETYDGVSLLPQLLTVGPEARALSPSAVLRDVLEDGQAVALELRTAVPVDEVGCPIVTPWFASAFCVGEAEGRAERVRRSREEEKTVALTARKGEPTTGRQEGENLDVRVNVAVTSMHLRGSWPGSAVEEMGLERKDAESVNQLLRERLPDISLAYDVLTVGGGRKLQLVDFCHFVHAMEVFHAEDDVDVLKCIFHKLEGDSSQSLEWAGSLGLALVRVALCKSKVDEQQTLSNALELVFGEGLGNWLRWREQPQPRDIIHALSQVESSWLRWGLPPLERIFELYADSPSTLPLNGFAAMMRDCEVLDGNIAVIAEQSFRWVQRDPPPLRELPDVTFHEFLLALARVSNIALDETMGPLEARVKLTLDAVLELGLGK